MAIEISTEGEAQMITDGVEAGRARRADLPRSEHGRWQPAADRRDPVAILVIETGANDGLRGLNVDSLAANIQAIIDRARQQTPAPRIVLVGMRAPPNNGFGYARRFREVYPELAKRNHIALVPFLLEGVAGTEGLNQADMIHPTAAGQRRVAETVWRVLEGELRGGER